jgi:monofunctional biosynthetic peptidoglycan transglycosylase
MLQARLMDDRVIYHQWQPLSRISPHLQMAVIAAEDQKFPTHFGFDFESIADALDEKRSRRRGASTISQQVAKNLYLWNGRSYVRKGIEAYLTLWIEILWSKERILEVYLNIAEFGPGVYGAQAASRRYFHKPASQITPHEAALLAAVLPNPKRMSAARPSRYVRDRATEILAVIPSLTDSFPIR